MQSGILIDSFADFANRKNIDRPTMMRVLEDVFRTMIRKKYNSDENFDVIINVDKGDLEILRHREIVANDTPDFNEVTQIKLRDAQRIEHDFEEGERLTEPIQIVDFGRRLVQTARQTLIQKIKDLEKELLFQKYKELVGEVVNCEVYQVLSKELIVVDGEKNELSLPKTEQIYKDRFRKGDHVRAIVHRVEMVNGNPKIILSRTSGKFLERLFETEVPEIFEGLIMIRKVVREPGDRAKVAVESYDDRIDPVGACVGMKGTRIHTIVRELDNENIDVINYTENLELLISRALSPAKISNVKVDADKGRVAVWLHRDQVSLAIGKSGQNIKLASKLVGLEIDVFREEDDEDDEDVEMSEFSDVVEKWIIDELHRIGLDTAKSVLLMSREDLIRRTELEEETVDFVLDILHKEFE
jgi:transcription termination/antitermination protein NusA